jgi:hypothetical protein
MRRQSAGFVGIFLVCAALAAPVPALANCAPGGQPTYRDIEGVEVQRGGTVGFIYRLVVTSDGWTVFHGQDNTPVKGWYEGHDGQALFTSLVNTLRLGDFFSLRLNKSPKLYVDGPYENIEVMRCGVVTAIGGLGVDMLPFEADLDDAQTARFDKLISTMQGTIFAWPWSEERQYPATAPSPRYR